MPIARAMQETEFLFGRGRYDLALKALELAVPKALRFGHLEQAMACQQWMLRIFQLQSGPAAQQALSGLQDTQGKMRRDFLFLQELRALRAKMQTKISHDGVIASRSLSRNENFIKA